MTKSKASDAMKAKTAAVAPLLTVRDVAKRLQVSERTVRRLIEAGDLAVIHIGGLVRVSEEALRDLLTGGDRS